ncbi:MAG: hypothetical protein ACI8PZ_006579 [Myxococcota bacterium]|jgi:hypothetical protein
MLALLTALALDAGACSCSDSYSDYLPRGMPGGGTAVHTNTRVWLDTPEVG